MYTEDDYMTRRERVGDDLLRRLLDESGAPAASPVFAASHYGDARCRDKKTWGIEGYPLASLYAPLQEWRNIYDDDTAFEKGTIFKELDLPYTGVRPNGGVCNG